MRQLLCAVVGLALLVLAASPAFAGEVCEGDGYKVKIPAGFKETMSMTGAGQMNIKTNLGMIPMDGMPETTIYMDGDMTNPRGTVIVARVNIKSGHEVSDLDDLGTADIERMQDQMPEGFEMTVRKVGTYDAIQFKMPMELGDEEMMMRMIAVAGGDFVMVVMLQTNEDAYPASDTMWESMVSTMELSSGTSKVLLYGGIGFGALILLAFVARFAGRSRNRSGGYVQVNDWRQATHSPDATARPGRLEAMRERPGQLPPRPQADGAPVPPPVPGTPAAQPPQAPAAPGARPQAAPPSGRPGLRPTLPPSGNWSDRQS